MQWRCSSTRGSSVAQNHVSLQEFQRQRIRQSWKVVVMQRSISLSSVILICRIDLHIETVRYVLGLFYYYIYNYYDNFCPTSHAYNSSAFFCFFGRYMTWPHTSMNYVRIMKPYYTYWRICGFLVGIFNESYMHFLFRFMDIWLLIDVCGIKY